MSMMVQDTEEKPEIKDPPTSDVTDMPESEDIVNEDDDDDAEDDDVEDDEAEDA